MTFTVLDCETTTTNNGDPYDPRNVLCLVGVSHKDKYTIFDIEYTQSPYKDELEELQQILDNTTVLVGFNLKFDLAWLRNYGLRYNGALWDTQYGEYLISNQRLKWYDNSLDNAALRCKLPPKKEMEWDVDTRLIPAADLYNYLLQDIKITESLYGIQRMDIEESGQGPLMRLHMQDLYNLLDTEYYGLQYARDTARMRIEALTDELSDLRDWLFEKMRIDKNFRINLDSPEHLSCILFGGTAVAKWKEPYTKVLKTGKNKGQEVTKNKTLSESYNFEGFLKPIKETAKPGVFSVDKWTLNTLKFKNKRHRELIENLIMYSEKTQLLNMFYKSYENLLEEHQWGNTIHGQVNSHRTVTGRTSSDRPNQQNQPDPVRELIWSYYVEH